MEYEILKRINGPEDVKKLGEDELVRLAAEMRTALIKKLGAHGGHSGPNLGFVEATVALHYVFDSPDDKMVFDVSHQTYCHKMLTGMAQAFYDSAHYDDVSGYSNPNESRHDLFTIGHTSTSVSLAAGLAKARDLAGGKENVIAVIGDGSLSGGEALEGLDFIGEQKTNFILVVNDNEMSIAENHGGLYENFRLLRETDGKAELNLFKAMGLDYIYVADGNDVKALIKAFESVKDYPRPIAVHIHTVKGKGLAFAEQNPERYHAGGPFDIKTGKYLYDSDEKDYGDIVSDYLLEKMKKDGSVVAITSGTPSVFGFTPEKRKKAGKQFVDVGIAEETAAALASGIAKNGGKPVWGVFSTFVQRTYDQISQDICINKSPVTVLVFGGASDFLKDVTHLGFFDIPLLSNIPELLYLAPTNCEELLAMTEWSLEQTSRPVAIRVPFNVTHAKTPVCKNYDNPRYEIAQRGEKIAVLAVGNFWQLGEKLCAEIEKRSGFKPTLINPVFVSGTDDKTLNELKKNHDKIVTLEDGVKDGGFGQKIAEFYARDDVKVYTYGLKTRFEDRYDHAELLRRNRLTPEQITEDLGL